jgi:hypothetical protein
LFCECDCGTSDKTFTQDWAGAYEGIIERYVFADRWECDNGWGDNDPLACSSAGALYRVGTYIGQLTQEDIPGCSDASCCEGYCDAIMPIRPRVYIENNSPTGRVVYLEVDLGHAGQPYWLFKKAILTSSDCGCVVDTDETLTGTITYSDINNLFGSCLHTEVHTSDNPSYIGKFLQWKGMPSEDIEITYEVSLP